MSTSPIDSETSEAWLQLSSTAQLDSLRRSPEYRIGELVMGLLREPCSLGSHWARARAVWRALRPKPVVPRPARHWDRGPDVRTAEPIVSEVCAPPSPQAWRLDSDQADELRAMPSMRALARTGELPPLAARRRAFDSTCLEAGLARLCATQGVPGPRRRRHEPVSVVAVTRRPPQLEHLLDQVARQVGVDLELVLVLNDLSFDPGVVAQALSARQLEAKVISTTPQTTLGECLELGRREADGATIAKFDDDDHYGPHHLADSCDALDMSDAALVGRRAYYARLMPADEMVLRFADGADRWVRRVCGATIVFDSDRTAGLTFPFVDQGEDTLFFDQLQQRGLGIWSLPPEGFVQTRHADHHRHTWPIALRDYRRHATPVDLTLEAALGLDPSR